VLSEKNTRLSAIFVLLKGAAEHGINQARSEIEAQKFKSSFLQNCIVRLDQGSGNFLKKRAFILSDITSEPQNVVTVLFVMRLHRDMGLFNLNLMIIKCILKFRSFFKPRGSHFRGAKEPQVANHWVRRKVDKNRYCGMVGRKDRVC